MFVQEFHPIPPPIHPPARNPNLAVDVLFPHLAGRLVGGVGLLGIELLELVGEGDAQLAHREPLGILLVEQKVLQAAVAWWEDGTDTYIHATRCCCWC